MKSNRHPDNTHLSIVMPVLNEGERLASALRMLEPLRARGAEVVVVDGGSNDDTSAIAERMAERVLQSDRGRAVQMNAGAAAASGGVLLFLHADTFLPEGADTLIAEGLAASGLAWGRFDVRIEGRPSMLRVIARMMNLRSRLTGIATGDQAMFVRRTDFQVVGGFPVQALMEDIELSKRLKVRSAPLCLRARATTSGRRWEQHGVWRTMVLMWRLRLRYWLGAAPDELAEAYR